MMKYYRYASCLVILLLACGDPRSTKIPADLADMPKIQSSLDKLDSVDRGRVAQYEMRAHLGAMFGASPPPAGVTIGEAIDNQKAFVAAEAKVDAERKVLAAKVAAERARKLELMSQALSTTLIGLEVKQGAFMGSLVYMHIAFQNRGAKPIAGVKGIAIFRNMFGDTLVTETVSYDKGIASNEVRQWRQIAAAGLDPGERRLAETPIEKIKFSFEPSIIIFEDGTKLEAPGAD
jgi:hypothetical protein